MVQKGLQMSGGHDCVTRFYYRLLESLVFIELACPVF